MDAVSEEVVLSCRQKISLVVRGIHNIECSVSQRTVNFFMKQQCIDKKPTKLAKHFEIILLSINGWFSEVKLAL
jgi:hypothetical protein